MVELLVRGMGIVRDNNNENKGYEKSRFLKNLDFFINIRVQEGMYTW